MQRKANISPQTSVTQMHFAVVPYEVQYLVPNDQIYQVYFEKGLQILGTTQYPIENHQKIKSIQLPIANNVIPFRLFSQRNSQYQWSIYKRVSDMQEYLESKKINLKDILKKQPLKKLELDRKNKTERKDSSNTRRIDSKSSEIKGIGAKTSQFKPSDPKSSQLKTLDQNSAQKLSEFSVQGKGCIYDQQIKSDLGHFILKFYVFRAFSHQQLSKTIEEKSRQKKQVRTPLSQISVNKISQLPKVSEIEPKIQQETKKDQIAQPKPQQQKQKQVQIYPTLLQAQKAYQPAQQLPKESAKQQPVQIFTKEQKQQEIQQAIQEKVEQKVVAQQVQEIQGPAVLEGSSHQIVYSPIHGEKLAEQQPPVEQVPPFIEQTTNERPPIIAKKAPFVFSTSKKLFVVSILLIIVLYVLYSMNLFDNIALPQTQKVVPKKQKKEKFSNCQALCLKSKTFFKLNTNQIQNKISCKQKIKTRTFFYNKMSLKSSQSQLNLSNGFKKRLLRPVSTHKQNDPKSSMKNSHLLSLHDHITIKKKYVEAINVLQRIQESLMESNNSKVHNKRFLQPSSQQNLSSSQQHDNTLSLQKLISYIKQKKQKQESINTQTGKKSISANSTKSIETIMSEIGTKNLQQGLKILYMQSQQVQQFLQQVLYILAMIYKKNFSNISIEQKVDFQHLSINQNELKPLMIAKLLAYLVQHINHEQKQVKDINFSVRNVQQLNVLKFKPIISYEDIEKSKQLSKLRQQLERQKQINNEQQNKLKSLVNKSQLNNNRNNNDKTKNKHEQISLNKIQTIHKQIRQVYQQQLSKKDELIVRLKSELLFCQQKLSKQQSIANLFNVQSKQKESISYINTTNQSKNDNNNNNNNQQKQFMLTVQQQFQKMRHGFDRKFRQLQQQHIQKQQIVKKQLFTLQKQLQNIHRENNILYKKYQYILNNS